MKKLIYCLLPLQIIVLLLSPRFGWYIHNYDAAYLSYQGTSYEDGEFHCLYQSQDNTIDIRYSNPFSKNFTITVNENIEFDMIVNIDGASMTYGASVLPGISNDIVWKDTYGIMFWRCILTIAMTLFSMKIFRSAMDRNDRVKKLLYVGASIIYIVTLLISLRIIF